MEQEYILISKMIGDRLIPLKCRRQRFESVMDKIDAAVYAGASKRDILTQFSNYVVENIDGEPVKRGKRIKPTVVVEVAKMSKAEMVAQLIEDNPGMSAVAIAKQASSQLPSVSWQNFYYYARKQLGV